MAQSVDEKYKQLTLTEHVLEKSMWVGDKEPHEHDEIGFDRAGKWLGRFHMTYSDALYKCVDEVLVNAADQVIRTLDSQNPTTKIDLTFAKDGSIAVFNNGDGIEVEIHEKSGVYVPEFIFGHELSGSNMVDAKSIIGGTNGIGAKITNIFSKSFKVDTICAKNRKRYVQEWGNNKKIKGVPVIVESDKRPYTKIEFMLDYSQFGYKRLPAKVKTDLDLLFYNRMIWLSIYCNYHRPVVCTYNGKPIDITSLHDLCEKIVKPSDKYVITSVSPPSLPRWEIAIIATSNDVPCGSISTINGVVAHDGPHIGHIQNQIKLAVEGDMKKYYKVFSITQVKAVGLILFAGAVAGIKWNGQRKDDATIEDQILAKYQFSNGAMKQIRQLAVDALMPRLIEKTKEKAPKINVPIDKYAPALYAGKKRYSADCNLILVEGDSAMGAVLNGCEKNGVDRKFNGVLSLGGVIINPRKEIMIVLCAGKERIRHSEKLKNNKFMQQMQSIIGLRYDYAYDPASPTYEYERSTLRYGAIIGCVDQDLDGIGNIFGLILNVFELFWSGLLKQGFVKRFETPIMRAIPNKGGKAMSFYNEYEYLEWLKKERLDAENVGNRYRIRYYKGLASHSTEEIVAAFRHFADHLFEYIYTEETPTTFDIYYGKDADKRKVELRNPARNYTPEMIEDQVETREVRSDIHLQYETFAYCKDNLGRKLCGIDGLNECSRKILDASLHIFRNSSTPVKVDGLSGDISHRSHYHHGEASMCESIFMRGFIASGGCQIPMFRPFGDFGTRSGATHGSARYVTCDLNPIMELIYPQADYNLLEFNFDDGDRVEPTSFMPILPMAIMESMEMPSTGWKLKIWARDFASVINNVRAQIITNGEASITSMPPARLDWTGEFRGTGAHEYSFGKYTIDGVNVHITELPYRTWTLPYVKQLEKMAEKGRVIKSVVLNNSGTDTIDISVKLLNPPASTFNKSGADCIEQALHLCERMDYNLNIFMPNKEVVEATTYQEIIKIWFPMRRDLFIQRIARQLILAKLKIMYLENIIRYLSSQRFSARTTPLAEMISILDKEKYQRINVSHLLHPNFEKTQQLEELILHRDASFDYLLNLPDRAKSAEEVAKYAKQLASARHDLIDAEVSTNALPFAGANIWLRELATLETKIIEGLRTKWQFGDYKKVIY